jgi:hypothetical protein
MEGKRIGKTWSRVLLITITLLSGVFLPAAGHTDTIDAGWDLLTTTSVEPNSGASLWNFQGVPLYTYNFGGTIGSQYVGSTDTIIQRVSPSQVTTPGVFDFQVVALQLVDTTDFPSPVYVTLDSAPSSVGTMTINSDGTFSDSFTVYFDVRYGSINSAIASSGSETFSGSGDWSSTPAAGTILIPGVNYELNGINQDNDFFIVGPAIDVRSTDTIIQRVSSIPEPSTFLFLALGLLGFATQARRFKR